MNQTVGPEPIVSEFNFLMEFWKIKHYSMVFSFLDMMCTLEKSKRMEKMQLSKGSTA